MRKFTDFIMIPFVIFALVVLAVMGFKFLLLAITLVSGVLVGLGTYAVNGFPADLASLFSDPIRVIALPIAIGLMIALGYWGLNQMNEGSNNFVRGRQMGNRTKKSSHRGSNRPSTRGPEKKSLPVPTTRKNVRPRR